MAEIKLPTFTEKNNLLDFLSVIEGFRDVTLVNMNPSQHAYLVRYIIQTGKTEVISLSVPKWPGSYFIFNRRRMSEVLYYIKRFPKKEFTDIRELEDAEDYLGKMLGYSVCCINKWMDNIKRQNKLKFIRSHHPGTIFFRKYLGFNPCSIGCALKWHRFYKKVIKKYKLEKTYLLPSTSPPQ